MTKFKVGDAVVLTNPGTRYTSTDCDTSQARVSFMNVLQQYTNNKIRPDSGWVHDEFPDASDLLTADWKTHGIVVAIDPERRLNNQAYAVVFTNLLTGVDVCCIFGEHGLKAYKAIHTSTNKNKKNITKQEILQMLESAYRLGRKEHNKWNEPDKRALFIFDTRMSELFDTPMTYNNNQSYETSELPF